MRFGVVTKRNIYIVAASAAFTLMVSLADHATVQGVNFGNNPFLVTGAVNLVLRLGLFGITLSNASYQQSALTNPARSSSLAVWVDRHDEHRIQGPQTSDAAVGAIANSSAVKKTKLPLPQAGMMYAKGIYLVLYKFKKQQRPYSN